MWFQVRCKRHSPAAGCGWNTQSRPSTVIDWEPAYKMWISGTLRQRRFLKHCPVVIPVAYSAINVPGKLCRSKIPNYIRPCWLLPVLGWGILDLPLPRSQWIGWLERVQTAVNVSQTKATDRQLRVGFTLLKAKSAAVIVISLLLFVIMDASSCNLFLCSILLFNLCQTVSDWTGWRLH